MHLKDYIIFDKNCAYCKVKVTPKSQKNEFFSVLDDGTLKIRIKAVAEKWKANKELLSFLSHELGVTCDRINILAGAGDPVKMIKINL